MKRENERFLEAKYALQSAVIKLLENKSWDELSITELCKTAGVNRSTFYTHYDNIPELLFDTRESYLKVLLSNHRENNSSGDDSDQLLFYLNFIKNNRKYYYIFLLKFPDYRDSSELEKILIGYLHTRLRNMGFRDDNEIKYLTEFYIGGSLAVVKKWLDNDCAESAEFIRDCINKTILK